MSKTKKNQIRVSFIGNNAEHVTGSCTLITTQNKKILIECGLIQDGGLLLNEYIVNTAKFKFKPKDIDYIFICHMHTDHIGLLPRLYAQGCQAKIIAPEGNYQLGKILLKDSAYIMSKDVESLKRKTGKEYSPIFTSEDVDICMNYWTEYSFDKEFILDDELKFKFIGSGHIMNAAQLELTIKSGMNSKKIGYTSDLGPKLTKYYSSKFQPIGKVNLLIGENTYNSPIRSTTSKDRKKDIEKIKCIIEETCLCNNSKVLIPVFANDRCQNILTFLYQIWGEDKEFKIPIIIDSPMAVAITKLYEELVSDEDYKLYKKVIQWDNVHFIEDYEDSKILQQTNQPMIVLSCSGMLVSGRSVSWLSSIISNPNNHVLFVGYSTENSLASKIKQGKSKTITIDGKVYPNKCHITSLKSFSSHMQYSDLLDYYSTVHCDKICLVHGDKENKNEFCNSLSEKISNQNKTTKVICVNKSTEILL